MICEICNKSEATIHIQEIVNSQKKSLHICQECASKKKGANSLLNGLNLADILYNISTNISAPIEAPTSNADHKVAPAPLVTCGKCGWSTVKFSEKGRLGCAECYNVFKDILSLAFKNMHKGTMHVGKRPGIPSKEAGEDTRNAIELMKLQKQLEEHILREEFEKAAELRDKIALLKNMKTIKKKAK
ncbi:MAG: UvrB/UvrC motif-containing protein [Lentisphaerae bacterium]|nr:UvrB/UvrC motif-containing protein [Lentisphaerota bacterium]